MAWFRHHYYCAACDGTWLLHCAGPEVDDCPFCHAREVMPYRTDDWTLIIEQDVDGFVVLASRDTADDDPDYQAVATFPTREQAQAYLAAR